MLDLYGECVEEVLRALSGERGERDDLLREIAEARRARIARDKRRYWRISCDGGNVFLLYVDMVKLVLERGLGNVLEPDHAAGLSVVPVVVIPPSHG